MIHHLDLWRVSSIEEALTFGLEEYFEEEAVTLIEWPGDVGSALGEEAIRVELAIEVADTRRIDISIPAGLDGVGEKFVTVSHRGPDVCAQVQVVSNQSPSRSDIE